MAMMALRITVFLFMVTFGINIIEISGIVPDVNDLHSEKGLGVEAKVYALMPWIFVESTDDDGSETKSISGLLAGVTAAVVAGFILAKLYVLMLFSWGWIMSAHYLNALDLPLEFKIGFTAIIALIYFSGYAQLKSSMGWQGIV